MKNNSPIENDPGLALFTIENAADGIIWHDCEARIQHVNQAVCDLLGYTREEMVGRTIQDINPNSTNESWAKFWQELQKKKGIAFEDEHRTKDGRIIPMEIKVNFIEFEGREYAAVLGAWGFINLVGKVLIGHWDAPYNLVCDQLPSILI